jgi:hypothetical protein
MAAAVGKALRTYRHPSPISLHVSRSGWVRQRSAARGQRLQPHIRSCDAAVVLSSGSQNLDAMTIQSRTHQNSRAVAFRSAMVPSGSPDLTLRLTDQDSGSHPSTLLCATTFSRMAARLARLLVRIASPLPAYQAFF